jgi:DNA segregation ATPase FtsK/SpoIIIE, S-DNA-T family
MGKRGRRRREQEVEEEYYAMSPETKKGILIIFLFAAAIISILSFTQLAGSLGIFIDEGLGMLFGLSKYIFPAILLGLAYTMLRPNVYTLKIGNYVGVILFVLGINGLLSLLLEFQTMIEQSFAGEGGGLAGLVFGFTLQNLLGFWASLVLLIAITVAAVLLMFNTSLQGLLIHRRLLTQTAKVNNMKHERFVKDEEDDEESDEEAEDPAYAEASARQGEEDDDDEGEAVAEEVKFKSHGFLSKFRKKEADKSLTEKFATSKFKNIKIELPLSLLNNKSGKPKSGDIQFCMDRIETTLRNFGIDVQMDEVSVGPTVTQYTFKPADGIKLTRITTLSNDLALALAAHPIRIEAPIPGKSLVGIEVPNATPAMVTLRSILESPGFKQRKTNLTMALGKDVSGKCWSADLTGMPHLLVAGATGSGKSVCLNTIILSYLYQNNPDMLRFIMVDPKRVEFTVYNGIPHLLTPVITDVTKTVNALRWAIQEMDKRFDILSKAGKRNIAAYNLEAENKMPYIVIVIDELADLMVSASSEIETSIIRLTQMARAVGIHLIVATQRPSVDVITGLIKANIPARVAFSVASSMDSRTILDCTGAEKLIGKGDMLLMTADMSKPRRLQGAYVSDDEIKKVATFLQKVGGEPEYDDSVTTKQNGKTSFDMNNSSDDEDDVLMSEAKRIVVEAGKASASLLQRRLRLGYARAARLIDLLEQQGIVGPADGARPREVLMNKQQLEEDAQQTTTVFKKEESDENDEEQGEIEEAEEDGEARTDEEAEEVAADNEEEEVEEEIEDEEKQK